MKTFKYFRDPNNFAYKMSEETECSVCKIVGVWFDASGFYGSQEIECICDNCLEAGKLIDLDIYTNADVYGGNQEATNTVMYKTPKLPSWQDIVWPSIDDEYCVFERFASKEDFDDFDDFQKACSKADDGNSDLNFLWKSMPNKRIKNYNEGPDLTVYLFSYEGTKYCIWDAN